LKTTKKMITKAQVIGVLAGDKKIEKHAIPVEITISCKEN